MPEIFQMKRISEMTNSGFPTPNEVKFDTSPVATDQKDQKEGVSASIKKSELFKDSKKRSISVLVAPSESRYSNFGPLFDKVEDESVFQYALGRSDQKSRRNEFQAFCNISNLRE